MSEGSSGALRRFDFERDTFAFANELVWEYHFDAASGRMQFRPRQPRPSYAHRCFVLTQAARKFQYHARFEPAQPAVDDATYRKLIRQLLRRNPRRRCPVAEQIVFPGFASLRKFSAARPALLKDACGGAWRSYVLPSHWRMVFRISREHQERTTTSLEAAVRKGVAPMVHLVCFPALTINHGMIIFDASETTSGLEFLAYDPNDPAKPAKLGFDRAARQFTLPANTYWAGGKLDLIEICRRWYL